MFEGKILTTKDKPDWLKLLESPHCQDPHYMPEYLQIYEDMDQGEPQKQFGGEGLLFVYGDGDNYILYPFIKKPILESKELGSELLYDIAAPYGYGGPLACIRNSQLKDKLWSDFYRSFHQFCQENSIVAEFARLNPIFENHVEVIIHSDGVVHKRGKIVYFDLTIPEEAIMKNMSKSRRQNIKSSLDSKKYEFGSSLEPNYADIFYKLYDITMKRIEAEAKYLFSERFFQNLFSNLGCCCVFHYVKYEDAICSAAINLAYEKTAYLYLQASNITSSSSYANVFLVYNSLIMFKALGFRAFVLGGGVSASEDSLFQYKYLFSPLTKESYIYNRIHIKGAYERLVGLRKARGEELSPDYFPQYRSPVLSK